MIDDAGGVRSFYRHHGAPCEAPVSGNVECPRCRATKAFRDPLYGDAPTFAAGEPVAVGPAVPGPREAEVRPRRARRGAGTWHRYKFSALITLEAGGRPGRQYLSGVPGLVLHAPSCRAPARHQYFPAVVYTDDNRPLRPGGHAAAVVISVPDDDASAFFQPGQHFTLWDGRDIGRGTVGEHLYFQWFF
jgi:hypothetical protein